MSCANPVRARNKRPSRLRWTLGWAFAAALAVQTVPPAFADSCEDDPPAAGSDKDYASGKLAIERRDWQHATRHFEAAARRYPDSADIQSYLGFAYRKADKPDLAFKHYQQALKLDSRHRIAHQYIGEAYLDAGDLAGAEKHRGALRQICLLPCEELANLEREIAEYRIRSGAALSR